MLEILIEKYHCVGSTKMRGQFLLKLCGDFNVLLGVGLFDLD